MESSNEMGWGEQRTSRPMHAIPRKPVKSTNFRYDVINNSDEPRGAVSIDDIWRPREEGNAGSDFDSGVNATKTSSESQTSPHDEGEHVRDSLLKSTTTVAAGDESDKKDSVDRTATWRPTWLRPLVLVWFASLFLFLSMALAVMLWYSQTNRGLFETRQSILHTYLWRFGPTALLTILAIFWARVEVQAMMYMPWIALRSNPNLRESDVVLDYTSMFSPLVLTRSFRHKHYFVLLVALVSVILKAQIVLAPSLYSLATIKVAQTVDILFQDSFELELTPESEYGADTSAYYMARAQHDFDMVYPYGVAEDVAYQTFTVGSHPGRGTVNNPVTATVDGFFAEIQCVKLVHYSILEQRNSTSQPSLTIVVTVELRFDGCEQPFIITSPSISRPDRGKNTTFWLLQPDSKVSQACSGLPQRVPSFLYFTAMFEPQEKNLTLVEFRTAAAVICEPHAWVSKVQVTDDGAKPTVTILSDERRTLVTANFWTMLNSSIPSSLGRWNSGGAQWLDGPVRADLLFRSQSLDVGLPNVFTNEILQESVQNLTRRLAPFIGNYRLRRNDAVQGSGTSLQSVGRLTINPKICLSMIALFIVNTGIAVFVLWHYHQHTSVWHRDPATHLGNLIFLRDHPDVASRTTEIKDASETWKHHTFTPLVLKMTSRGSFCLFTILLASSLILTLRVSETSDGLATIDNEGYLHLMWTSFPAIIALGVSLYISSCDWAYRDLATLYRLSRATCNSHELDRSLLDMLGLRALYYSFRYRLWSVTFSQSLAFVCGLLTSLVSIIFTVEVIPGSTSTHFQQKTWFQPRVNGSYDEAYGIKQTMISSLWIRREEANLTYPDNTFDDLAFHAVESIDDLDPSKNLSVTITTPAAKVEPQCIEMTEDKYTITYRNYTEDGKTWYYANINEKFMCPGGVKYVNFTKEFPIGQANLWNRSYIAGKMDTTTDPKTIDFPCKLNNTSPTNFTTTTQKTYAWGAFEVEKGTLSFFTVWRCNYSWYEIDTEVNLVFADGRLVIDMEKPPQPDMSSMRLLDPPLDLPPYEATSTRFGNGELYPEISLPSGPGLGVQEYFTPLVKPYGTLDLAAFGDRGQRTDVLRHIHHNYAFSAAQLANTENRRTISADSGPMPPPVLEATLYDNGRRRLVQNPNVTYAVVGILGAVILFNIWALASAFIQRRGGDGRLLDMDVRGLAPDGIHSIASVVGLLRESNAAAHLPPSPEMLSSDELHGQMAGLSFRLGWFRRERDQTRHFTIGVMGDGDFNFMGVRRSVKKTLEATSSQESVMT
ncbi:hypothetical protein CORC01_13997 [Colletotrichum orchidophilum]|uniref:Uncharacterized protein n=1 Tax=Colletotrichum orchidophilum TaxID=1209926 RepID=A0A1G4ANP9_9PEZI|nr:uncharacterized protein CORC01_13997 [Colletotrichum orchidophilum]OHE90715.1 hypothetical protein CORC01_13997 [Colletotrichum orchidophilum]